MPLRRSRPWPDNSGYSVPGIAASSSAVSCVVSATTCSVPARTRSRNGFPNSTAAGAKVYATHRRYGAKCARRDSPARWGSSSEWARRRRLAEKADQSALARTPSARSIARLTTLARDDLSTSDGVLIAAIIDDFQHMIRSKAVASLEPWLEGAKASLVGFFANGVQKDIAAVRNAIASPWSNGQTEGQITKLKLVKRQMYGRAKIDLLQARLVGAT